MFWKIIGLFFEIVHKTNIEIKHDMLLEEEANNCSISSLNKLDYLLMIVCMCVGGGGHGGCRVGWGSRFDAGFYRKYSNVLTLILVLCLI